MKKVLFFVAVAAFVFLSCERHELETPKSFTFKASIEDFATKADMNTSNQLVWATGDKIGIYVPGWNNEPFTLVGDGGSTTGTFSWDNQTDENSFADNASAAFFPWQGTGSDKNNVYDDGEGGGPVMYFKLPHDYQNYTSGQMLTPLIASLENSLSDIKFKHAGAAVKVTINNLPAGVHSIGMTVDGQQIFGDYHINLANVDPEVLSTYTLAVDGNADPTHNSLWLNFAPVATAREFTFVFPVPTLSKPKLSFQIWDSHNLLVWSKNLKEQTSNLGRADVLVMPAIDITPYNQFNQESVWSVIGTINNTSWNQDFVMLQAGSNTSIFICKNVTFKKGDEFKVRKDGKWEEAYPISSNNNDNNWVFPDNYTPGQYDVFIEFTNNGYEIWLVQLNP